MKRKVILLCDWFDEKASKMGALNLGVEYMGRCRGRIVYENGELIGEHSSSSFGWLRKDLIRYLDELGGYSNFDVFDLIGLPVPKEYKKESKNENKN